MSYLPSLGAKCSTLVIELIKAILNDNNKVVVHNGEDWVCLKSNDLSKIVYSLNSRHVDLLRIRCAKTNEKVGWIELTYENNLDQPLSIITKHADNDYTQQLLAPIYASWE